MTRGNRRVGKKDQTLTSLSEAQTVPTRITFRQVCHGDYVIRHATRRSTPGRFSDVGRERNDPKSRCFHIQNLNDHAGARIDGIQASNSAVGAAVWPQSKKSRRPAACHYNDGTITAATIGCASV